MKRIVTLIAAMAVALGLMAAPALASHRHGITTPGVTGQEIARGNTCVASDHPAYHVIHDKVHLRAEHPAEMLATLTGGKVSVASLGNC